MITSKSSPSWTGFEKKHPSSFASCVEICISPVYKKRLELAHDYFRDIRSNIICNQELYDRLKQVIEIDVEYRKLAGCYYKCADIKMPRILDMELIYRSDFHFGMVFSNDFRLLTFYIHKYPYNTEFCYRYWSQPTESLLKSLYRSIGY